MNSFDKEYRENLLFKIRYYVDTFKTDLENNGELVYNADFMNVTKSKATKVISILAMLWGILILSVVSTLIYREIIVPIKAPISLHSYIIGTVFFTILLVVIILINIKQFKQIKTITINKKTVIIDISKGKGSIIHKYYLKDISLKIKRQHQQIKHTLRGKKFNVYISDKNSKNTYFIKINSEEEFFAFVLYILSLLNNLNIASLSDDEIYKMYHSSKTQIFIGKEKRY